MTTPQKTAVITGASTGIGRACAATLIEAGWRVFGSVRKEADGQAVADDLGEDFIPLLFDVTDETAIADAAAIVDQALEGRTLDALINNAGVAVSGAVRYLPLDDLRYQFDVNVYGVLRTMQAFLPHLGADHGRKGKPGKIINISSVAGKIASPFMSPYAMSKHAVEALSESARRELLVHGIDVVVIGPGAVSTPIWSKAEEVDLSKYRDTEYFDAVNTMKTSMTKFGGDGLPAEAIGALALKIINDPSPKTRYAVLKNKFFNWTLARALPPRMLDNVIANRFGLKKRKSR